MQLKRIPTTPAVPASASENELTRGLLGSEVGIALLDEHGWIRGVNEAWGRFAAPFGGDEVLAEVHAGANYLELCARAARSGCDWGGAALQGLREVLSGSRPAFSLEYAFSPAGPPANQPAWCLLHAIPCDSERGSALLLHLDVTDHKRAAGRPGDPPARDPRLRPEPEQAAIHRTLELASLQWRSTFDAIQAPILTVSLEGRVERVNRAARELLGREERQILGVPIEAIGMDQPWGAVSALARRIGASGIAEICEVSDERGERTWEVEGSVSTAPEQGEVRIILQVRDITKTVRLQESLRRSETMAALGAVIAGVAHEVRNPLFGISAVLDAFEDRFEGSGEHQRYLPLLRAEVARMTRLMQSLLDLGRPPRLEFVSGDVAEAVEQAFVGCRPLAASRSVQLTSAAAPRRPPVLIDRHRLNQALTNVIENAIQHSPAGSEVRVETAVVRVGKDVWVRLAVRDQGPGFLPPDLTRVLEPFYSRRAGGTGLGLAIVARVLEEHGGRVKVSNHPAGGAQIDFELPAAEGRG